VSMSSAGYSVVCDVCEERCAWECSRSAARATAKRFGWFRRRGGDGQMMDVCPDCHCREVIARQQAAANAAS
jgi:hypothetical protein